MAPLAALANLADCPARAGSSPAGARYDRPQAGEHAPRQHSSIVASREFARGLDEVRKGLPFNPDNDEWDYERGRAFGFIVPLGMPLRIGTRLNPQVLESRKPRSHESFCYEEGEEDQSAYTSDPARSDRRAIAQGVRRENHRRHPDRKSPNRKPQALGAWRVAALAARAFDLSYRTALAIFPPPSTSSGKAKVTWCHFRKLVAERALFAGRRAITARRKRLQF